MFWNFVSQKGPLFYSPVPITVPQPGKAYQTSHLNQYQNDIFIQIYAHTTELLQEHPEVSNKLLSLLLLLLLLLPQ